MKLNTLLEKLTTTYLYTTCIKTAEFEGKLNNLLTEKGGLLSRDKRYEGYCCNGSFQFKDSFVTKTKTPPSFSGVYHQTSEGQLLIEVNFQPTQQTLTRIIPGLIIFFLTFLAFLQFDSVATSFTLSLIAPVIVLAIVFFNYKDSLKSKKEFLEEQLELHRILISKMTLPPENEELEEEDVAPLSTT